MNQIEKMGNGNSSKNTVSLKNEKFQPELEIRKPPESLVVRAKLFSERSKANQTVSENGWISRDTIEAQLSGPARGFGTLLFCHLWSKNPTQKQLLAMPEKDFIDAASEIVYLLTDRQQLNYYFKLFSNRQDAISQEDLNGMLTVCFKLICAANHNGASLCDGDQLIIDSVAKSMTSNQPSVTSSDFCEWTLLNCPTLFSGIHHWVLHNLTGKTFGFHPPSIVDSQEECTLPIMDHIFNGTGLLSTALLWMLTCSLPHCYTRCDHNKGQPADLVMTRSSSSVSMKSSTSHNSLKDLLDPHQFIHQILLNSNLCSWTLLYDSSQQGLSLNRFQYHCFSYHGPTLMLILMEENNMLCVASTQEWKESITRYGGEESLILEVLPQYKTHASGKNLFYLNEHHRGYPKGFQFGADSKSPILEIDGEMNICTFKKIPYRLKAVEVWGCAGHDTKEAQAKQKQWESKQAERARKVALPGKWEENPDKYLLELAGVRTEHSDR